MKNSQVTISAFGNILEWLDFGLFIFLAPIIADQFFPADEEIYSVISTFSVFAAGFICRPIGGIIFGYIGDKYGRANPLRLSILLISITTFSVGLLPVYAKIGFLAPVIFTVLRLLQGIAIGGECSGILVYLAESAKKQRRGFITSFAATGANIGFLLASLIVLGLQHYLSKVEMGAWGWRLPFLFIGFIGSVLAYFRLKLLETPAFKYLQKSNQVTDKPLSLALRTSYRSLLRIFGLNCMSASFFYVFFGFMPEYLQTYINISSQEAYILEVLALSSMLVLVPIMGFLGDRFGRKNMLLVTTFGMVVLSWPMFYMLQKGFSFLVIALACATLISTVEQGSTPATIVENCPLDVRYSGIAFAYNIGAAIFGGFSPLIVIWLTTFFNLAAPGFYIMLTSLVGFMTVLSLSDSFQEDILRTT